MIDGINNIPVAIVGGGPVGLLLALFLDLYGVRSVIFNSDPEVRRHPKGSTHNSHTMEHHRRLGIASRVRDLSLPINRPTAERNFRLPPLVMDCHRDWALSSFLLPVVETTSAVG